MDGWGCVWGMVRDAVRAWVELVAGKCTDSVLLPPMFGFGFDCDFWYWFSVDCCTVDGFCVVGISSTETALLGLDGQRVLLLPVMIKSSLLIYDGCL